MSVPILYLSGYSAEVIRECLRSQRWPEPLRTSGVADYCFDVIGETCAVVSGVHGGPDGADGALLCVWPMEQMCPDGFGYFAGRQQWVPAAPGVMMHCPEVPQAAEIERHSCVCRSARSMAMANGSIWEVPVLREPQKIPPNPMASLVDPRQHSVKLPETVFRDPRTGQFVMEVLPQYRELFEQSRVWFEYFVSQEDGRFNWSELTEFVLSVIGLRYRWGHLLQTVFSDQLVTTSNVWDVVELMCGFMQLKDLLAQKKS